MPLMDFDRTVPYVRKTGVAGFFQLIYHNLFDLVLLNLLFVLTSLPVCTVGASLLALNAMTLRMVQDEPASFCKEYIHFFKRYFKDGVISGMGFCAALGLTAFAFFFYFDAAQTYPLLYPAALAALTGFVLTLFTATFYFSMLCCVQLKKTALLKNAGILGIVCFKRSLLAFLAYGVLAALLWAFFPYSVPFFALGPVSLSALAACCAAWEPIQKYVLSAQPQPPTD